MLKRTFAMILAAILISVTLGLGSAGAQTVNAAAERARAVVTKAGVGQKAKVEVKLPDNTKVKGYVSDAGADSFTVTDSKTGAARTFAYNEVEQIKKSGGGGLSSTTKAIIWGGVAAGAIITLYTVRGAFCDGQC
jgi:hypothetical protein